VRELRNILERSILKMPPKAVWLTLDLDGREKTEGHSTSLQPSRVPPNNRELRPIEVHEYALIREVLEENDGAIRRSAAQLGLTHQALLRRLKRWPELRRIARGG
jgi:transcriptional regulator with PAS, ATPase and Fis domain